MALGCGLDQSHKYPESLVHGTHRNTKETQSQKEATTIRLAGFIVLTCTVIPKWGNGAAPPPATCPWLSCASGGPTTLTPLRPGKPGDVNVMPAESHLPQNRGDSPPEVILAEPK